MIISLYWNKSRKKYKTFSSIEEVAVYLGRQSTTVSSALYTNSKIKGWTIRKGDAEQLDKTDKPEMRRVKVIDPVGNVMHFRSMDEAAHELDINSSRVKKLCDINGTYEGLEFSFAI